MNKRLLLIIGGIAALAIIGVVAFLVISNQSSPPPAAPAPVAPQALAPLTITTTSTPVSPTASASANVDIFLNTGGTKIDGFQFIATLDGAGQPIVSDADPNTPGIQIEAANVSGLNPVTNSVAAQGTAQVVRFAMITQTAGQPFSSTTPVKVATITYVPQSAGTITLDFNTQNTRANKTGSTADTLITAASQTFNVTPSLAAAPAPASGSAKLASNVTSTSAPAPVIACNAACLTDSDCSSGLSCINNACLNPTCSTSTNCLCGASASTSPTPTPKPTATPKLSATPTPTPSAVSSSSAQIASLTTQPVSTIAALPKNLPVSGSTENTIILIVSGLFCIALAAFFMLGTI